MSKRADSIPTDSTTAIKAPDVDVAAVQRDTPAEARPSAVKVDGSSGAAGELIAPETPDTIVIWSVLSSPRCYNVPITLPKTERHGAITRISRVTILPGENVIQRTTWEEMKNYTYYKRLLEGELIGEGPMPNVHRKNTFDRDANGQMTMAPANKRDIGVLCPKSREVVAQHKARIAGDHLHVRILGADELARAGYQSGDY